MANKSDFATAAADTPEWTEYTCGWATTKKDGQFQWLVYAGGYKKTTIRLAGGFRNTRAQAVGQAKRWALYYRRLAEAAA